jgi:hypothetical protein
MSYCLFSVNQVSSICQLCGFKLSICVNISYISCRFYVGCDRCQGWFHGSCVGITQTEADNIDSYICPKCKNTADNQDQRPLTEKDYESLKRLVRSLQVRSANLSNS